MVDIFIVKFDSYNSTTATLETEYFSTGAGFDPKDDSIQEARGILEDAGNFESHLFGKGKTSGNSSVGIGEIVINNNDGTFDFLRNRGLDGRALEVLSGSDSLDNPSDFTNVFSGTIKLVEYTEQNIILRLKNGLGEFYDTPITEQRFSGDTGDASHVNGTPNDWGGKNYPLLIGNGGGENFAPPMVNAAKQTFCISRDEVDDIDTVFMRGATVTKGTLHATLALLQAATVTAGQYDYYKGDNAKTVTDVERGTYFRIGSALDGTVTCKAHTGATDSDRTMAQNANDIFNLKGKTLDSASVTAIDGKNSSVCGYWSPPQETKTGIVLDAILGSGGIWWTQNNAGLFIMGRLEDPAGGTSVTTIEQSMLLENIQVRRITPKDTNAGLPISEMVVNYNRNYTLQSEGDLAGIVGSDDARVLFLKNKFRTVRTAADAGVLVKHLTAIPFEIDSYFTVEADAQAESDRQKVLRTQEQDHVELTVDKKYAENINVGDVIEVEYDRYTSTGLDKYLVLGRRIIYKNNKITLRLWRVRAI